MRTLALAVALIPLGTAFTFPCVTALLSRIIKPRERGLFMGMQQTYGGVARAIAPLFFGWSFDRFGISSPYFIASAIIMATIFLGLGLDKYAKHEEAPVIASQETASPQEAETAVTRSDYPAPQTSNQPLSAGSDK